MSANPLLQVEGLKTYFPIKSGPFRRVTGSAKAVDDVSFTVETNETTAIVGESGCGKTTTARSIVRAVEPTGGRIMFRQNGVGVDILAADRADLREIRRSIQMVFQDPYSSLNNRMTVKDIIGEPLFLSGARRGPDVDERIVSLMRSVGLDPIYLQRYPHAFSGGQRQRIAIARALALNPKLVIADEPTSALDVSIQAQILNLLLDLQREFSLSYLFISHDLSVVKHISDQVIVMYVGNIVEMGRTSDVFRTPKHPYTEALLSAVPFGRPGQKKERIRLTGTVPDPANLPPGCPFATRCRYARGICTTEKPELAPTGGQEGHRSACHFSGEVEFASYE